MCELASLLEVANSWYPCWQVPDNGFECPTVPEIVCSLLWSIREEL